MKEEKNRGAATELGRAAKYKLSARPIVEDGIMLVFLPPMFRVGGMSDEQRSMGGITPSEIELMQ